MPGILPILWAIVTLVAQAPAQSWSPLGPAPISNAGDTGRISAIVCHPTLADRYYVSGADGGVWRTDNGGASWTPLTDHMPTAAIGALALDPSNPEVIYAGTGEANFANHSRYGLGIYKSVDGGANWSHLAETTFAGRCISRIVVHPTVPTLVYASVTGAGGFPALAAAKGHPGANGPLGVFRSTDGGHNWTRLSNLPDRAATDLVMDPSNPSVLYAGIGHIFGDAANGVYKSSDGGDTWGLLAGGLPTTSVGRVTLAIAPSNPQRLYVLIARSATSVGGGSSTLGAFRTDNAGQTWTPISAGSFQATYGWYLCVASVHPTNPDTLILGGLDLIRTTTGGSPFSNITPPHVDMHALAWDAAGRLLVGDDGGVHRSSNLGTNWESRNAGLGTVQFYAGISTHPTDDARFVGGTQDNGTNLRSTNTLTWTRVLGGDGGWTQWDQANPLRVFAEFQGTGGIYVSTNGGTGFALTSSGIVGSDRNCFLPPYLIDPTNSQRMLYATHRVYQSLNGGSSWSPISADLTAGGDAAIRAIAMSPVDPQTVYAATNDGRVLSSTNGGANFTLRLSDAAGWPRVTREITADTADPATAYLAGATYGAPHVRRTRDRGQTWQTLDGNLPDIPVNVIVADNRCAPAVLYAGTDAGIYHSHNDGATWQAFGTGFPRACVIDLKLEPARNRLIAATQGRGAWTVAIGPPCECDTIDFNHDTLSPDTLDIADFLSVFTGGVCAGQQPTDPPCNTDIDFNNDGLLPDIADIDALIRVFAGGACE